MRHFNQLLFLGNGKISAKGERKLRGRIKEGLVISSGLQQGVPLDSPEYHSFNMELEDIVRDIAAALLGREIQIGDKLPYPNAEKPTVLPNS